MAYLVRSASGSSFTVFMENRNHMSQPCLMCLLSIKRGHCVTTFMHSILPMNSVFVKEDIIRGVIGSSILQGLLYGMSMTRTTRLTGVDL